MAHFLFAVRIGNFYYFLFIFLLFALVFFTLWLCHKFGKTFSYRFISIVLWANFALHFLKQFLPHIMNQWPVSLTDSALPNLCAVLIVAAPFIFHFGDVYTKDYLYYIGVLSGLLVYFVPTGAMRTDLEAGHYAFEVARFYLCHWPLVVCGLLMVEQGFHKLDWKRLWAIPFLFCGVLALITVDQILFGPLMKVPGYPHEWIGEHGVLNRLNFESVYSNQSMQFGPQPGVDKMFGWLYPYLIPGLMTYRVEGAIYFTPVIWIFPFIALGAAIIGPVMALPFEGKAMKMDILAWQQKRKLRALHKRAGH